MDPNTGRLYDSIDAALLAGVRSPVEISGTPEAIVRVSKAVKAQHRAKRKAQKKARRANRG